MPTTLTRQELYELVWTQPRTTLAKELGVSDVAIGKHCSRAQIPAPPAGYWARLSAGGAVRRTPLPLRLPGQSDTIEIGHDSRRYYRVVENLDEPVAPPSFAEDAQEQVSLAVKRIGRVAPTRDLQTPDPALSRVLAAEARRKAKHESWSFYEPYFDGPAHQRQLRIFNSLARALTPLYGRQEVRCEDKWTQGIGTRHFLVLHLDFGATSLNLCFFEPSEPRREERPKSVTVTTLSVGSEQSKLGLQEWSDGDGKNLEAQLTEIVGQLLRRAEASLRTDAQWRYEQRLERRKEELAAREARKREEEKRRLAAIEAGKKKVRDEIVEIARRRSVAEEIRATVRDLHQHPEVAGSGRDKFQAWAEHALAVAASIDPMNDTLDAILGSFSRMQP